MKLVFVFFVVVALVAFEVNAKDLKELKKAKPKTCLKDCDKVDYKPVCATEGSEKPKSFGNKCVLENYNCEHGSHLVETTADKCVGVGIRLS